MNLSSLFPSRALLFCALSTALCATQTRTWSQGAFDDFQNAAIKNLSLRSDGVLTLAPHWMEYYDTSAMYLWSLARDSKGNLYAAGGTGAKLYRIGANGKGSVLAELDALEIHAIAVDSKDRVYVATAPDGKVYRVSANGKAEPFYDPKAKYIWALAFDRQDNLYVATGDPGTVHRVAPDGKGQAFFQCDETHVRSLALDTKGNLIVGTAPGGLVMRVSPSGEGFVLYQMSKPEVTTVAVAPDGAVYAAGVGTRRSSGSPTPAPAPQPAAVAITAAGVQAAPRQPPPPLNIGPVSVSGGSDLYRIEPDGMPRRVWTNSRDVVYAIAFDRSGRVLLGTGNRGSVYRIDSPTLYTVLFSVPATQVTAFQTTPEGRLFAATGNVGKVYEIDSTPESQGTIESDVFDSGMFTRWGRLSFEGKLDGGRISIQTRTGNLNQPEKHWSPWSASITTTQGERITSPAARFVQWKATLTAAGNQSPELDSVDVAYLPQNVAPRIERIEITPANYKFPAPSPMGSSQTLSLAPLGSQTSPEENSNIVSETPTTNTPAMQFAKGYLGVRWTASDPNGDSLIYKLEIRGVKETEWKLLKDKVVEKYYSWDSTAFPDGEYVLRIIASDAPSNPPAEALTASLESDPFIIDNTPPKITGLTAARNGNQLAIHWHAADTLNHITNAEFSLDGGDWTVAAPVGGLSDSLELDYDLSLDAAPGEHTIAVRVTDAYDNQATDKVVVR
jgi:sugar lactone lactonase YvrE